MVIIKKYKVSNNQKQTEEITINHTSFKMRQKVNCPFGKKVTK